MCLAALHFNSNSCKIQAKTKKGESRYTILFPKYKQGGYIVRKVMSKSKYGEVNWQYNVVAKAFMLIIGYVQDLMSELIKFHHTGGTKGHPKPSFPGFLCSKFDKPNKLDAVKEKQTRFSIKC